MIALIEAKFSGYLAKIAHRSTSGACVVSACLVFCLALVIFTPSFTPREHGVFYTDKSMMPLNLTFPSLVQLRFFAPLLGAALGFSGEHFIYFPLICMFLLLVLTCYFLLNSGLAPFPALLGTSVIGFSSTMSTLLLFPGYVDAVAYLFILLAIVQIRFSPRGSQAWGVSMALAIFTHEATLALMPFMLWLVLDAKKSDWRRQSQWAILNAILAILPFILFRGQISVSGALAANWYLNVENVVRVLSETYAYIPLGILF